MRSGFRASAPRLPGTKAREQTRAKTKAREWARAKTKAREQTRAKTKVSHERYRRNQAPREDAVAEEDGDFHRQAELQPWPHQGGGGGEEALCRAAGRHGQA